MRLVTPYAFMSVKGGVGKSALAIAAAVGFARQGRPVAFLDADLTGTSIADGLPLAAPDVVTGGRVRWKGPASTWIDPAEVEERRRRRHGEGVRSGLVFLDDILFGQVRHFDPRALAWRLRGDALPTESAPSVADILWFPSSPTPRDVERAARGLFGGGVERLTDRLARVVDTIAAALGPEGVILCDLPPGMFGMPTLLANLLENGTERLERVVPVLVSTADRSDLRRSADSYIGLRLSFPSTRWILNRHLRPLRELQQEVLEHYGPEWQRSGVEQELYSFPHSQALALLYQGRTLPLIDNESNRLLSHLGVR